jgi:hypothetical protein
LTLIRRDYVLKAKLLFLEILRVLCK